MTGNDRKLPYKPCICPTMRKIDYVTRVKFWLISVCVSHLVVIEHFVLGAKNKTWIYKMSFIFVYALLNSNLPFIIDCQKSICQFTTAKKQTAFLPYCLFTYCHFTLLPFYPTAKIQESPLP